MAWREALQKLIFKTSMKMPDSMLVRLSGGAPLEIEGDILDARLQFIAHQSKARPSVTELPIDKGRRGFDAGMALLDAAPADGVTIENIVIHADDGRAIEARTYRPKTQDPDQPLLVWAHMGGGVLGGLETSHSFLTHASKAVGMPIVSVDYRLAPEHPYPAGLDDTQAVYSWALGHAERLGAPKGHAAIGGGSMGGSFAAVIAQDVIRLGLPKPDYQLLLYPALDLSADTPSRRAHARSYPLSEQIVDWFSAQYAPNPIEGDVRLSPGKETDLADLPPAFVYTAGFDMLRDEGADYAGRLRAQGVPCVLRNFSSLCHGFTAMAGICPAVQAANQKVFADLKGFKAQS